MVARGGGRGMGKMGTDSQKVQIFNYKVLGCNVQHGDDS